MSLREVSSVTVDTSTKITVPAQRVNRIIDQVNELGCRIVAGGLAGNVVLKSWTSGIVFELTTLFAYKGLSHFWNSKYSIAAPQTPEEKFEAKRARFNLSVVAALVSAGVGTCAIAAMGHNVQASTPFSLVLNSCWYNFIIGLAIILPKAILNRGRELELEQQAVASAQVLQAKEIEPIAK